MFLDFISDFIKTHGTITFIISGLVAIITLVIDKLLSKKVRGLCVYLPFLLGIIFSVISSLILTGRFDFSNQTVYAGFLSGSFSSVLSSLIKTIKNKKKIPSPLELLINEILADAFGIDNLGKAPELIYNYLKTQDERKKNEIESIILNEVKASITDTELHNVSALLLSSYETLSF